MGLSMGMLGSGGVYPGYWGPCLRLAGTGVPGRVLLPLACKEGCPLCLQARVHRAGVRLPGCWRSLALCPYSMGPSLPSTSRFTGCELWLGEEMEMNLGHGLSINCGFMGSFLFLIPARSLCLPVRSN